MEAGHAGGCGDGPGKEVGLPEGDNCDADLAFEAALLECGAVMVSDSTDYRLDAMPFGDVQDSGPGREKVPFAIAERTEPKVVCGLGRKGRA